MKTRKIGSGTLAIGLIGAGVLLFLNYGGMLSKEIFQYIGPIYIILFGIEVIWSFIRNRGQAVGYNAWSIIILVLVFISSATHMTFPNNFDWQPRFLSAVEGKASVKSEIKHIEIRIPSGKVEVTGTTTEEISYSGNLLAYASSQTKADEMIKSNWKIQQNGDTLELVLEQVGPKWNLFSIFDWTQKSANLNVQIPQSLLTRIETSNGSVHVTSMNADTDIKTSNGSITVLKEHGNVTASTSNGSGTFTDIEGSLNMHTNNGSLTLMNITGIVSTESSNGSIKGASMINGDWDIVTSNGKITLAIPKNSNASIEADTSNGKMGGDLNWQKDEKNHCTGTIGTGEHKVLLKSSNGNIDVNYTD